MAHYFFYWNIKFGSTVKKSLVTLHGLKFKDRQHKMKILIKLLKKLFRKKNLRAFKLLTDDHNHVRGQNAEEKCM